MKKILLIYTGGTIGMQIDANTGALVPFSLEGIMCQIPKVSQLNIEMDTISITLPIDSANASDQLWKEIGLLLYQNKEQFDAFLILHGTDTMAYSATACSFMLQGFGKPIVFTGSQLPISDPETDAKANIVGALSLLKETAFKEVGIFFNDKLFRATRATKIHGSDFDGFGSPNGIALTEYEIALENTTKDVVQFNYQPNFLTDGILVFCWHPLVTEKMFVSVFSDNLKVLIIKSYGSGTLPTYPWILAILKEQIAKGLVVILKSQCFRGGVISGIYETSAQLENAGILYAKDMTLEAVIIKSAWLLSQNMNDLKFVAAFFKDYCGELG